MTEAPSLLHDRLIPEKEVEDKLGWSPGTAAVKRCRQTLPFSFVRIGRQIRYRVSEVDAFVAANTVAPKSIQL